MKSRTCKAITFLYLFACPFVSAYALNSFITISWCFSILFFISFIFQNKKYYMPIKHEPPFLFIFWFLLSISFLLFGTGSKCLNQYAMWTWSFFIYYYVFSRYVISRFDYDSAKKILLNGITAGVFLTSVFVIIEFICKNIISFPIESIIIRQSVEEMDSPAHVLDAVRCRGFMTEPSHLGNYLVILAPLAIYRIFSFKFSKLVKSALVLIILLADLLSFSSGGFAVTLFAVVLFLKYLLRGNKIKPGIRVFFFIVAVVFFYYLLFVDNPFMENITQKLDSGGFAEGKDRRGDISVLSYLDGINLIIGYGPAAYSTLKTDSFISLVLNLIMNTGAIGVVLFLFFLVQIFRDIKLIKERFLKVCLVISFLDGCLYFIFSDLIYVPWFWIVASCSSIFCNLQAKTTIPQR